jgi:hypothetical protein
MTQTVCVLPPAEDRGHLLAIVADRNRPLKHVRRAQRAVASMRVTVPGRLAHVLEVDAGEVVGRADKSR